MAFYDRRVYEQLERATLFGVGGGITVGRLSRVTGLGVKTVRAVLARFSRADRAYSVRGGRKGWRFRKWLAL